MPITEDFDVFVQRYKGMNKKEVKVNNQKRRIDLKKEDLIRLTPEQCENVHWSRNYVSNAK